MKNYKDKNLQNLNIKSIGSDMRQNLINTQKIRSLAESTFGLFDRHSAAIQALTAVLLFFATVAALWISTATLIQSANVEEQRIRPILNFKRDKDTGTISMRNFGEGPALVRGVIATNASHVAYYDDGTPPSDQDKITNALGSIITSVAHLQIQTGRITENSDVVGASVEISVPERYAIVAPENEIEIARFSDLQGRNIRMFDYGNPTIGFGVCYCSITTKSCFLTSVSTLVQESREDCSLLDLAREMAATSGGEIFQPDLPQ